MRRTARACAAGEGVEVVSVAGWVEGTAAPGDVGCVARVEPLGERVFVALADGPHVRAGETIRTCLPGDADLAVVRAVAPETLAGVEAVRATYAELFGQVPLVPWTDWGRVGLPLTSLSPAEVEAEWAREGLLTPEQRSRAVVARGPAWLHFTGVDAPGSDVWARPETIVAWMRLARGWLDHCVATGGDPERCTPQVGDLAWYNARDPDPLGHRDHAGGACVDVRLFRTDGSRYEAWWNRPDDRSGATPYDGARTADFLRWTLAHAPVGDVFFNDPRVVAAVPGVRAQPGHDDHVHLCFEIGGR